MIQKTYSEKLQHPLWQKKRLEILTRDSFTCTLCSDTETTLHIHHKEYRKGCEPWEYEDENFQTLCKHCHAIVEDNGGLFDIIITAKQDRPDAECIIVSSIIILDEELGVSIDRIYNRRVEHVVILKRSTISSFENLFKSAEKLIECQTKKDLPITT